MRTITLNWYYSYLITQALQREIQVRWKQNIMMANAGHGKHYWDDDIDRLADYLMEIRAQE